MFGIFAALPGSNLQPKPGELIAADSTGVTLPVRRRHGCALINSRTTEGKTPAQGDLKHLSPLRWKHIALTGDYFWNINAGLPPNTSHESKAKP